MVPRKEAKGRLSTEAILEFLKTKFPSYWVPDDAVFVDEIPKTGTGKFDKKVLRARYKDHYKVE